MGLSPPLPPPRMSAEQGQSWEGAARGGGWKGGDPDLDDSDAHTHAEDDAQVLLQPALHLLHAALRAESTATSPHDGPHHPDTQGHRGRGHPQPEVRWSGVWVVLEWTH